MTASSIPVADFGKTGSRVTRVGLGGEGVLRTTGQNLQALDVIETAFDQGIGYFDSARVYADSELYLGSFWKGRHVERARMFHTSKSANRTRQGALKDLEQSLARLNTDYLDLWQIHDLRTAGDLDAVAARGGALEAFLEAREKGLVRNIGVTGHHSPEILARAVEMWPVDSVLMPVNPVEEVLGGFLTRTLEAASRKGIAVIGMKVLGASHYIAENAGITPDILIRYALSHDITLVIVGCSSALEVMELVNSASKPGGMTTEERREIMELFVPAARKLAFYRGKDSL
ncbi:MAG: aldo/keto reductase [Pseudomonadota bacterium]